MTDTLADAKTLKDKIVQDLWNKVHYWSERKDRTSYENNEEYWWECKAHWSMFLDAVGLVEKVDCPGTVEQFSQNVRDVIDKNEWGWGANWSASIHFSAKRNVIDFVRERLP